MTTPITSILSSHRSRSCFLARKTPRDSAAPAIWCQPARFTMHCFYPMGRVLIGGAELYDPETCTFTTVVNAAPLVSPYQTILLGDGRVLIVGVETSTERNGTALYDPATRTLVPSGRTVTSQRGGWATLLQNGRVLVAGGSNGFTEGRLRIANPEVYDPSTGTFTATGPFATTGTGYSVAGGPDVSAVTLLADGRVLVAGEPDSELYDPATGSFRLTDSMKTPSCGYISGRTSTLLPSGKVLLTGGHHEDCGRFAAAELYDPVTETFTLIGNMTRIRDNHSATLLSDGTVLITGAEFSVVSTTTSAESFDPSTSVFSLVGEMTAPRAGHTTTLLKDGTVLIAGGYAYGGIGLNLGNTRTAEIYVPQFVCPNPSLQNFDSTKRQQRLGPHSSPASLVPTSIRKRSLTFAIVLPDTLDQEAPNWQKGTTASHVPSLGIAVGTWTITGVRPHQMETDHTGSYAPVLLAAIIVTP